MRKPPRARHARVATRHRTADDRSPASLELSELRHRTQNLLQTIQGLLGLEARRAEHAETQERLHDLALRVDLLAGLHQRLNALGPGGDVDAGALIRESAEALILPNERVIALECEVEKLPLDGQRAQSLALLVHEALTNVTRHAFQEAQTGRVVVRARQTRDGGFLVEVADNGRGMRPPPGSGGLGLRLMRTLALRLGGELRLEDGAPGLKLTVLVPPPEPVAADTAGPSAARVAAPPRKCAAAV
ncbi:MAG TPA: sensor histidine kinase [Geminicoccaceae bacterium]|nr:sensor histidine kinase [Geminicoccaceae bacterium]